MKPRIAVLISGRGSNMTALIDACKQDTLSASIALVVSNKPEAKGLETAAAEGIATAVVNHKEYASRAKFDDALHACLLKHDINIICLAGFMRILGADFISRWPDRILNIHPSLLPAFPGLDTHERTLETKARYHGCTVHIVRPKLDCGPILMQAAVTVKEDDSADILAGRVLVEEHKIYPLALKNYLSDYFAILS